MTLDQLKNPLREVFSVSQLNRSVRQLLETQFPLIWVEGEISNFSCPASGHWYFTLKDEQAQVRCAMFKGRNSRVQFRPESGLQVMIRCRVGLYENRGDFQLIAEHMEEAGHGILQRRFEALKTQLAREGLFEEKHKQALPSLPTRIGIITSATGAAVHDIITILGRRFPAIPVTVFPCNVQGAEAAAQIVSAIQYANQDNRCDVLIVGRGGGSLEDLWSFNEESVARAIFNSAIPIVSAVGHEVDFTIADFVADARAATPSAAAEMLSPDARELASNFVAYQQALQQTIRRTLRNQQQQLDHLSQRMRHPGERIHQQQQQLTHLQTRLHQTWQIQLQQRRSQCHNLQVRLNAQHPQERVQQLKLQISALHQRLTIATNNTLQQKKTALGNTVQMLNTVSPLHTLERGYAIVKDSGNQVVRKVANINRGDKITALFTDGSLLCRVDDIIETEAIETKAPEAKS